MAGGDGPAGGGPAVRLRPIEAGDQDFLCAVYASTREEELRPVPWTDEQKAAFLRMQFEAQHRYYQETYTDSEFLVVLVDEERAGRLYVGRWEQEIRLIDVALLPAHRGRGVGTRLVTGLLREADARGLPVRIHVERQNPALRLYERLGFRMVEDRGVYLFLERPPRASEGTPGKRVT